MFDESKPRSATIPLNCERARRSCLVAAAVAATKHAQRARVQFKGIVAERGFESSNMDFPPIDFRNAILSR